MSYTADLHIHTNFSDGSDSPEEVVRLAVQKELKCIAITDHDILDGIDHAQRAAEGTGLEVIAGLELSTNMAGADVHILGYCFDVGHPELRERLKVFCQTRIERVKKMVARLREMGKDLSADDVLELADSAAVGRPHVAQVLVNKGYVKTVFEAFDEYLAQDKPAYIPKFEQTPLEAIRLIRQAGGVAVMAHPMQTLKDEIIPSLVGAGLRGLEVYYPNTSKAMTDFYAGLADKYGLIKTGGSDAHGYYRSYSPIGMVRVDYSVVEQLKAQAASPRS